MRKLNLPLLIGAIILVLLFTMSIFPELYSDADPYGRQKFEYDKNSSTFTNPVSPPSKEYPWGSDFGGRDLKSLIIYGCKTTMLVAFFSALGRLLVALPVSISAAYGNIISRFLIKQFNIIFSALPLILLILLLSGIRLFTDLFGGTRQVMIFLLIFLGWSKFANVLTAKIKEVLDQDFIEGEVAIGKTSFEIACQNIIPHIIPTIIVMFFMEMAMILLIMTQLGVFGIVFSGGYEAFMEASSFPFEFDWANLLRGANYVLTSGQYIWILIFPAIAFAVSIIGLNLFGEGLRSEFEKRDSMVISFIRRLPSILSPLKYFHQLKNFKDNKSSVYIKSILILLLITIVFYPQPQSIYKFSSVNAFNTIAELSGESYNGRLAGTEENKLTVEYIQNQLKAYGIKPFKDSYIHEFDIDSIHDLNNAYMSVSSEALQDIELRFRQDFIITSTNTIDGVFELYPLDLHEIGKNGRGNTNEYYDKLVIVDVRGFREQDFNRVNNMIQSFVKPKGVVYIEDWFSEKEARKTNRVNRNFSDKISISVSSNIGEQLLKLTNAKINLKIESNTMLEVKGYNVVGFIEGTDEKLKNEYIVIGSSIDYIGDDKEVRYPGATAIGGTALELDIARVFAEKEIKPKRSIVFAFWDGTVSDYKGSANFIVKHLNDSNIKVFNIDLRSFISSKSDNIIMDTTNVTPKDKTVQNHIKVLKKSAKRNNVALSYGVVISPITQDMNYDNKTIVIMDSFGSEKILKTSGDSSDKIEVKKLGRVGQMLLDAVIEIACSGY